MRIVRAYDRLPPEDRGCAVAIGNFDGVHRGHQAVIAEAARAAAALEAPLGVMTFDPHPVDVLKPDAPPARLTRFADKAERLAALGVARLYALPFTDHLRTLSAERFIDEVLAAGLGVVHVVVGFDFRFGHERRGDLAMLKQRGAARGFSVSCMEPVSYRGAVYSSSAVRKLIRDGDVRAAARLLERPHEAHGTVVKGDQKGREFGFPTANIVLSEPRLLLPPDGIYAVRARIEGEAAWRDAVAYLGRRQAVAGSEHRFEVHLFDYDGDLYGRALRVRFVERVRADDLSFDGVDALIIQIGEDCARARALLQEHATGDVAA